VVKKTSILLGSILLLWCGSQHVVAHPDDLKHCSEIDGAVERLSCFDRALSESGDKGETDTETNMDTIPAPVPVKERSTPGEDGVTAIESARKPLQKDNSKVDEFGETPSRKSQEREMQQISSTIVSVRTSPLGNHIMELHNGQVWMENEAGRMKIKSDQQVTIVASTFRSYRMKLADGTTVRVHRID
jgi:hypothetical protein